MASMPNRDYSWDEMVQMYEIQMVSSYEKARGRTIHGEEISALAFWLIADTERRGFLEKEQMKMLMLGLRFPEIPHFTRLQKDFGFSIAKGELRKSQEVFRFDLMRQIFLDWGL